MFNFLRRRRAEPVRDLPVMVVGGKAVTVEPDYRHFFPFSNHHIVLSAVPVSPQATVMAWLDEHPKDYWKYVYTKAGDLWGVAFVADADAEQFSRRFGVTAESAYVPMLFDAPRAVVDAPVTAPAKYREFPAMSLPAAATPVPLPLRWLFGGNRRRPVVTVAAAE